VQKNQTPRRKNAHFRRRTCRKKALLFKSHSPPVRSEYGTEFVKDARRRLAMLVLILFSFFQGATVQRGVASMQFPQYRVTSDVDDILESYPNYLKFVLTIGKAENPTIARQIEQRFFRLKKADEKLAASFLKGLRFEMHQKLELMGYSGKRINTENPALRRWVGKYLGLWLREVDEYQFRAYASTIAKRNEK
jgi:hypothetical protein